MAASIETQFDAWLSKKLQQINPEVDLEVFVSYIKGILETETSDEDLRESIEGILGEIVVSKFLIGLGDNTSYHGDHVIKSVDSLIAIRSHISCFWVNSFLICY